MLTEPASQSLYPLKNSIDIFPWDDNFETGLIQIDDQHRVLVSLLNTLASHVAFRSEIISLEEVFDALTEYTIYHFKSEEAIWAKFFAEDHSMAEHLAVHEHFIQTLTALKEARKNASSDQVAHDALEFLTRWLASHILEKDRCMAYTVLAMQEGFALEEAQAQAHRQMKGVTRTLIDIILSLYSALSSNTLNLMRKLDEHQKMEEAYREQRRRMEHLARFDALTGLPNRVLLTEKVQEIINLSECSRNFLAIIYLDLDGFKVINDTYGHEVGDRVLIIMAERIQRIVRGQDIVSRLGGDEFIVVIRDIPDFDTCIPWLASFLTAAGEVIPLDKGRTLTLSASLGVTLYPQNEEITPDQLFRQADQALYQAKQAGKNCYHVFDMVHDHEVRDHLENLEHIRLGLERREFVLYYQPKVNLRTGAILGFEALIRWQHPHRGLLLPAQFLPMVENHPLALSLGNWVLDTALNQIEDWMTQGSPFIVSVNVCGQQLQARGFTQQLRDTLARRQKGVARYLELEVLETSALEDISLVSKVIHDCISLGVQFSIDDFGTGYSSLSYLKRLPVHTLKIDQSFVRGMLEDPEDLAILVGVLGLAEAFQRKVIAEGVETLAHGEMLLDLGCEGAQGYAIARPMPVDKIVHWAASWQVPLSWRFRPVLSKDDLSSFIRCASQQATKEAKPKR
ncbi:putative bifunctional diguanylate cyclase/phosphodiesterase [Ferrovum myxofaciens]|uniref:Bacteriohemerythrin n=2 Tax=root TaxID=1 RepID=A0A9E6SY82_9PROT|nr:bacteriohemerythrin [Ferrovum myxofaciens]QKE37532.1 MAG: bacteriohemerythrin [Ferrovum myxofaciens]QWY75182.1 MAG: bacteriohemerythrin [Ferrovum myxofaciens]QWY77915.1 MAG: bacteriohemerythrin [Ferrovum myxofaciens]